MQLPESAPFSPDQRLALATALGTLSADQADWLRDYLDTTDSPAGGFSGPEYGRKHPFPARLKSRRLLNGPGSAKETWHLEFDLAGSGLTYTPGDSLALLPQNAPDVVDAVLAATGLDAKSLVDLKDTGTVTLREALTLHLDITGLNSVVLGKYNLLAKSEKIASLLDPANTATLAAFLRGRQIVDMLEAFPCRGIEPGELAGLLRKMPPRLYSIASSIAAHPDEVHLTVASVRYETHGRARKGVASTYIADILAEQSTSKVYTHHNKNFKLPADPDTPILMVGPGTGIAPFRSFIEDRAATGARGKSWLFFGDQHASCDFLYREEWEQHLAIGTLTRLDTAFSRDQANKIYVQQRMREHARDLWDWLEAGAHFYVCGDASRMAADVHGALIEIAVSIGGLDIDAAEAYFDALKKARRYQRDVY